MVVDAPEAVRRERLRRRGLAEDQITARMATQPTREEWLAGADEVLDNSGTEADLRAQVAALWRELTGEDPPVSPEG